MPSNIKFEDTVIVRVPQEWEWELQCPKILANLRREIPPPPKAEPRPQKSFATLKPGDRLAQASLGLTVTIVSTSNLGATTDSGLVLGRDWQDNWTRLRRPRKKKGAHSAP